MKIAVLLFLLFPLLSIGQTGSISGNALWKNADGEPSAGDGGSEVYLYPLDSSKAVLQTYCDEKGHFVLDQVKPARYLVAIRSHNTQSDGNFNLHQLQRSFLTPYLGFSLQKINKLLYDSLSIYEANYQASVQERIGAFHAHRFIKNLDRQRSLYEKAIERLLRSIPLTERWVPLQLSAHTTNKVFFEEIIVTPNQQVDVQADFGMTEW